MIEEHFIMVAKLGTIQEIRWKAHAENWNGKLNGMLFPFCRCRRTSYLLRWKANIMVRIDDGHISMVCPISASIADTSYMMMSLKEGNSHQHPAQRYATPPCVESCAGGLCAVFQTALTLPLASQVPAVIIENH